ncbi:MAG: DNA-binding response regulator [Desulfobacteraceae bacterium]|nr:MAG: DNA-binding response regulator [Desulfobacteraceae bacterium]
MIRVLIVDDEDLSRQALKNLLQESGDVEIMGECRNGFEAVESIPRLKPDLVFLDIQMPQLNGFDVVELLEEPAPAVIFVTAFDEYALKAFEASALDYLLKPVQAERLAKALEKYYRQTAGLKPVSFAPFIESHQAHSAPLARILVRDGQKIHIVPTTDIMYVKAEDDYVMLHTAQKALLKLERLSRLEKMLDYRTFCRIHRSFLLNIVYLDKIAACSKESRLAVLKNGAKLPISRQGYRSLQKILNDEKRLSRSID